MCLQNFDGGRFARKQLMVKYRLSIPLVVKNIRLLTDPIHGTSLLDTERHIVRITYSHFKWFWTKQYPRNLLIFDLLIIILIQSCFQNFNVCNLIVKFYNEFYLVSILFMSSVILIMHKSY